MDTKWPVDKIVSLSALALSLCGVLVSVVQTRALLQQQRANVWPHLEFSTSNKSDTDVRVYTLHVSNTGQGPANIRFVDVVWKDIHFPSFDEALRHVVRDKNSASKPQNGDLTTTTSYLMSRTLRAGDEVKPVHVAGTGAPAIFDSIEAAMEGEQLSFRIVYSSVYDDCWELSGEGTRQLEVCPE